MEVLLLKDIPDVGFVGQVKKVSNGFARNYLFPQKLAKKATADEVARFAKQKKQVIVEQELRGSRVAALAQKIKHLNLVLKEESNEQGKLYGAVGADEIVELLKEKGIAVNRKQIEFSKAIRTTGEFDVIIRLSSKLKPVFKVKVVSKE